MNPHSLEAKERAQEHYERGMALLENMDENYSSHIEHAIVAFNSAKTVYEENDTLKWAQIMLELGRCYLLRRQEPRSANIAIAIEHFRDALRVYDRDKHPLEWAECHRGLGKALSCQSDVSGGVGKDEVIGEYQKALQVISKDNWPELWHTMHLEIANTYGGLPDDRSGSRELAVKHLQLAFAFDKTRYPALYSSLRALADLRARAAELHHELRSLEMES